MAIHLPPPSWIDVDDDVLALTWCFGEQGAPDSWTLLLQIDAESTELDEIHNHASGKPTYHMTGHTACMKRLVELIGLKPTED